MKQSVISYQGQQLAGTSDKATKPWRRIHRFRSRPCAGVAMVLVLLCLVVVTASIGTMLRTLVLMNRHARRQAHTTQAFWLADSGIQRAVSLRQRDPQYNGETWSVTAEDWGARSGKVEIQVNVDPDDQGLATVSVVATFPQNNKFAVRARRETTIVVAPTAQTGDPTTGDEEDDNS